MLPIEQPFKTYTGLDGKPLDNGYVYFGQPDKDPITHPVTVYWDAAGTKPAAQPLRTMGGYIMNAGTPANVFFDGTYSELVQDKKRQQVFYARTSEEFSISALVLSLAKAFGSSLIGFIQAGVGAIKRTVQDKLREAPVSVQDYGAKGDGVTDDTAAFQRWAAAVSVLGRARALIPPANYKVAVPKGGVLCLFTGLNGVTIEATGATITDTTTYTVGQFADLFRFINCVGVRVGRPVVVSQPCPLDYLQLYGLTVFDVRKGCDDVCVDIEIHGCHLGVHPYRELADPAADASTNIKARIVASRCAYPYFAVHSGYNSDVYLDVVDCKRNFYLVGVRSNEVRVRSRNQKATSLIKAYNGVGCDTVKVDFYDKESDNCKPGPLVSVEWGDLNPATHKDIHLHFNVNNPVAAPHGSTFTFGKYTADGTSGDAVGRGHVLDGFKLSGISDNTGVVVPHVQMSAGAFAFPDVQRNISIQNFTGLGTQSEIYLPLEALTDIAVLKNVSSERYITTRNGTAGKVVHIGCTALSFTKDVTWVDRHDYISCNVLAKAGQNVTNNVNFYSTSVEGVLYNQIDGISMGRGGSAVASNTTYGERALRANSSGSSNSSFGSQAARDTTTGYGNSAFGASALAFNNWGYGNTAVGQQALQNNTFGSSNTALGQYALRDNVGYDNTTGIGQNAQVTGSNQIQLGNSFATAYAFGPVQNRSDIRDKADVRDTELGLNFILLLRPVDARWDMRDDYRTEPPEPPNEGASDEDLAEHARKMVEWREANKLSNIVRDGSKKRNRFHPMFIADEVKEAADKLGVDFGGYQDHSINGGDDVKSLAYQAFIPPITKSVHQHHDMIVDLLARYDSLSRRLEANGL